MITETAFWLALAFYGLGQVALFLLVRHAERRRAERAVERFFSRWPERCPLCPWTYEDD